MLKFFRNNNNFQMNSQFNLLYVSRQPSEVTRELVSGKYAVLVAWSTLSLQRQLEAPSSILKIGTWMVSELPTGLRRKAVGRVAWWRLGVSLLDGEQMGRCFASSRPWRSWHRMAIPADLMTRKDAVWTAKKSSVIIDSLHPEEAYKAKEYGQAFTNFQREILSTWFH